MTSAGTPYDVAVLGSGLAGATLAAIFARQGASVLMIEAGSHPRFAIGESTVPEFSALCRVLAEYFEVPELAHVGHFPALRRHISASSGIKRNFTFGVHTDGRDVQPAEWMQFPTLTTPLGPDSHIYRPDLDAWLTALAVRYGVTYRERTAVDDVELADDRVTLTIGAARLEARFLVDASGYRSLLARKLGLRGEPNLATNTRAIFTHMVDVHALQQVCAGRFPLPSPPDQGTLHHLFDGGWFWVIPFGNHSRSVNPVCSVGLILDRDRYPDTGLDAQEEFASFVRRFPTVQRQLGSARAVRSWVKTARLQYRSREVAGARWVLMPHSAQFVDPLFSGGMTQTMHAVRTVGTEVLAALRTGSFSAERFAGLTDAYRTNLEVLDRVIHGAYLSFRSVELFNAYYRLWAVSNFYGSTGYVCLHLAYLSTRDRRALEAMHRPPYDNALAMRQPRVRAMLDEGYAIVRRVEPTGDVDAAVQDLYALLQRQEWIPPQFKITRRGHRYLSTFTVLPLLAIVLWGKRRAPPEFRQHYYAIGPIFFWELTKAIFGQLASSLGEFLRVFRDAHVTRGKS